MVTCKKCLKSFKLFSNKEELYNIDSLCGRCRSRVKYLQSTDAYRKTKKCPDCGKLILATSMFCGSCSQIGERNRLYSNGNSMSGRTCKDCGSIISTGSAKGRCSKCYTSNLLGELNPNYRFGHYTDRFCSKVEYKKWRKSVYRRDGFKCVICGESHTLEAHHILPKRTNPELVFNVDNGITLCKKHHEYTFGKEIEQSQHFLDLLGRIKTL
jgi:hypothetical protein